MVSDQGMHCLSLSHKKDIRLVWVKMKYALAHFIYFYVYRITILNRISGFEEASNKIEM